MKKFSENLFRKLLHLLLSSKKNFITIFFSKKMWISRKIFFRNFFIYFFIFKIIKYINIFLNNILILNFYYRFFKINIKNIFLFLDFTDSTIFIFKIINKKMTQTKSPPRRRTFCRHSFCSGQHMLTLTL